MNTENMNTQELEARGIDQTQMGDVEGQIQEVIDGTTVNLLGAIEEFLSLRTKQDLLNVIQANF
jgi:hypothetical protein